MKRTVSPNRVGAAKPKLSNYPTPVAKEMVTSGLYRSTRVPDGRKLASKNACRGANGRQESF